MSKQWAPENEFSIIWFEMSLKIKCVFQCRHFFLSFSLNCYWNEWSAKRLSGCLPLLARNKHSKYTMSYIYYYSAVFVGKHYFVCVYIHKNGEQKATTATIIFCVFFPEKQKKPWLDKWNHTRKHKQCKCMRIIARQHVCTECAHT